MLTIATLGGTTVVVWLELQNANWWISGVYLAATGVFFGAIWLTLKKRTGLKMPLGKGLMLLLPGAVLLPLAWSQATWSVWTLPPLLAGYGAYVLGLRLISTQELHRLANALLR